MPDIIKLKRTTKSIFNQSMKVLEKDEVLLVTPDAGSGKGKYLLIAGDGATPAKSLPIAIDGENADEFVVKTIETTAETNPTLNNGDKVKILIGKIVKKFSHVDTQLNAKVTASNGDIANTKVSSFTASTAAYPLPVAGETPKVFMGKIKKFFEDIRNTTTGACYIGQIVNNCVTNNPKLPLSAAQGKVLMDLLTQQNSEINVTDISASFEFDNSLGLLNAKKCGKIVLCTIGVNGAKLSTAKWNTIATLINDAYKPNSGSSIPGSVSIGGSIDAGKHINCTYSIAKGTIDVHFMQPLEYNIFVQLIWFIK